jgi:hypothetical protein
MTCFLALLRYHMQSNTSSVLDDLRIEGDARDRGFEHPKGQNGQRPKTDARAGLWIVSCVGVIEAVTLPVSGGKTCRWARRNEAVLIYRRGPMRCSRLEKE